jgi:hypothetical protein
VACSVVAVAVTFHQAQSLMGRHVWTLASPCPWVCQASGRELCIPPR